MKRIVLFLATNIAVILVLSIILKVLGIDKYGYQGASYAQLLVFSAVAWIYAVLAGTYSGDLNILAAIVGLSLLTALYTAFAIFRANYERITTLRHDVIVQFLEFSRIWAPPEHQQRISVACTPSRDLMPAHFAVLVPIYGTLDVLMEDMRRWRQRRRRKKVADVKLSVEGGPETARISAPTPQK